MPRHRLAHPCPAALRPSRKDDDWEGFDPQTPADPWDPDALDEEEPEPEPGDFWLEPDDDEF
jgi:hypothetical protein